MVKLKAEGIKVVPAGDVLAVKRDGRKKTRTVMRGYLMEAGVHYNQTFAPVVQLTSLRVLLAIATKLDWEVKQGDCPTAFQQAIIDCEIWALKAPKRGLQVLRQGAARGGGQLQVRPR